jgi:hypothetical protein
MATEKLGPKECVSIALGGMIGGGISFMSLNKTGITSSIYAQFKVSYVSLRKHKAVLAA